MSEQTLEQKKADLINDLIACATVMEEIWKYHPENPSKVDIVTEYKVLENMKTQIELELKQYE
jgi:hypothetical protein